MGQQARDVCAIPACPSAHACQARGYTRRQRARGGRNWVRIGKRRVVLVLLEGPGLAGCCRRLCSPLQSRKAGRRPRLAPAARRAPAAPGTRPQGCSIALLPRHPWFGVAPSPGSVLAGPSPAPLSVPLRQAGAESCHSPRKGFGEGMAPPLTARSPCVLQMNRPIQVKPADSEGRGGRSPLPRLPRTGRGAEGQPGG